MSQTRRASGTTAAGLLVSSVMLAVPVVGWAQLEEIVVTTRKKEENIQDVPIAVDVISAEQIARRGITDVSDIVRLSPSVQFDQSFNPSDVRIAVRGLSNTRGRSNVAFLVDGVDVTTENFISAGSGLLAQQRLLTDVERIEIVKGPQSALYGRAAFAGAISYTTQEPSAEFESQVRFEAGNYGLRQLDGFVSGPVVGLEELLGVRWTGAAWNRDGFYTNATTGADLGDESGWGTALTFLVTPGDSMKIKVRTEYSDSKFGQRAAVRRGGGTRGRPGAPPGQEGLVFYPYPIDPEDIQGTSAVQTRLADFDEYCPESFPDQGSPFGGFCAPAGYGSASGLQPAVDVDPVTGRDYQGTDTQLWRTTLNASIDYDYGTFSVISGWTEYEAFDELDQDYQVNPLGAFDWKAHNQGRTDLRTEQWSSELRFSSSFSGPVNFTLGGMYWREQRAQDELNYIISCIEYGKAGAGVVFPDDAAFVPGICDGSDGLIGSWQERALDLFPCRYNENGEPIADPTGQGNCLQAPRTATGWRSTTEHWSAYFNLTWDLSDRFQLVVENRYVDESFDILKPNFSPCTNLFFPFGTSPTSVGEKEKAITDPNFEDIVCTNEARLNPNIPDVTQNPLGEWMLIEGTEKSSFNTPKVTLNWKPTDNALYYFSWGKGIKPGGINTLAAGGSPTTIDQERFEPEEVQAWELGAKTDWEVAGFLRLNGALFFNDYTDKQIGTQVVNADGVLQPRVVNAAAAEVWGVELEAVWQPEVLEGLIIGLNYTYLDATFVDFTDRTRSTIRAAYAGQCTEVLVPVINAEGQQENIPFCELDLSGYQLERTPEHAFVGNIQYTAPFADTDFDWFVESNASYQDKRFLDADNAVFFDDYWLVDVRGGFTGETFEFLLYVDNLFENKIIQTGGSGPDFGQQVTELGFTAGLGASHFFGLLPDPRTFGARVTMRF